MLTLQHAACQQGSKTFPYARCGNCIGVPFTKYLHGTLCKHWRMLTTAAGSALILAATSAVLFEVSQPLGKVWNFCCVRL